MAAFTRVLEQLSISPGLLVTQILGFLIVFAVLRKFLFGPIQRVLQEREERIRERLAQADTDRAAMEQARAEYEQRLSVIEAEARDRIQQAMQQAEEIRREMLDKSRTEAQEILARAREELTHERQKALVELRDDMARLAVRGAEKILQTQLDEQAQRRLVDSFLTDLERQQC